MHGSSASFEFRIPIAPRPAFYHRVRFFCAALRRLGPPYSEALVRVTVGDNADLRTVEKENEWSSDFPLEWHIVPRDLVETHGYFGTSDYRYLLPDAGADLVILADADTVIVRPFGDELEPLLRDEPVMAGHMAHGPPPRKLQAQSGMEPVRFWPHLFERFDIPWPRELHRYSIGSSGRFPDAPAYYNLGFIILNRAALRIFQRTIFAVRDRLNEVLESEMRCQIACTLVSYANGIRCHDLPASFNAANDDRHHREHGIPLEEIKVIHYLRRDEIDREHFLSGEAREHFLRSSFRNPINRLLQQLARQILDESWSGETGSAHTIKIDAEL
jgi:hypothetical protein